MRLIDADRLIKLLKEQKVKETGAYTKGINFGLNVAKCIINDNTVQSPITYDVEKVVEQLEEKAELAYRRYMDCPPNSPCFSRYRTQYEERKMCLEIVKGSGVNDIDKNYTEKLKAYESHYCSLCEKFGVNSIEEIYNKAIDDFKKEMIRSSLTEREKEYIRYKAEQLKAGGTDE